MTEGQISIRDVDTARLEKIRKAILFLDKAAAETDTSNLLALTGAALNCVQYVKASGAKQFDFLITFHHTVNWLQWTSYYAAAVWAARDFGESESDDFQNMRKHMELALDDLKSIEAKLSGELERRIARGWKPPKSAVGP